MRATMTKPTPPAERRIAEELELLQTHLPTHRRVVHAGDSVYKAGEAFGQLAIVFSAVNDQPPSVMRAIPGDFVSLVMDNIGLGAREVGLNAMVTRLKRYAEQAERGAPTS